MYAIYALLLGSVGLLLSRRVFGTLVAPLGIYSGAWAALLSLHYVVRMGNSGYFYELAERTTSIVFLAWLLWMGGCLAGAVKLRNRRRMGRKMAGEVDAKRLRLGLSLLICVGSAAPLLNIFMLSRTGALFGGGDAWRDAHFIRMRETFGPIGALLDMSVPITVGAVYAAAIGGVYAVVRRSVGVIWAILPIVIGTVHDMTSAGRFWVTQAPVLVVAAWIVFRRKNLEGFSKGRLHKPHPDTEWGGIRRFKLNLRTLLLIGAITGLSFGGLKGVSLLRSGLKERSDEGIEIAGYQIRGAFVSPLVYAGCSLALFNYYAEYGYDWDSLDGKIALGGLINLLNPYTRAFGLGWSKEVSDYSDATNEQRPIGPSRSTVYFATYLLPALSDFGDWGIWIYPLAFSFVTTLIFRRAYDGLGLFPMLLYPLCAVWVAMSVMRWELINSGQWAAMFWLLALYAWLKWQPRKSRPEPKPPTD